MLSPKVMRDSHGQVAFNGTNGSSRQRLAREQATVVRALHEGKTILPGFDPDQLRVTAEALTAKRLRSITKAWPAFAAAMSPQIAAQFRQYAMTHPPQAAGPDEDGGHFAVWLSQRHSLPMRVRLEFERWKVSKDGLPRVLLGLDGCWLAVIFRWGGDVRAFRLPRW